MADASVVAPARYSAFISYCHADAADARWLHRRLESYRLPRRLNAGMRLRPVFHDRAELRAAPDLDDEIRAALTAAEYLIVVCSPSAVGSTWVAREIELFRELHGDAAILAALFHGDETTAFPAGLLGARGHVPLAADFRPHHDGRRLALLKLVARLASVDLDALVQRDAHRYHRRLAIVAGVAVLVALAMAALAVVAVRAQNAAEVQRNKAEGLVEFMLVDLRKRLKGVGRLDLLTAVNERAIAYYDGMDLAHLPPESLERRAALLHAMGEDDEKRGNLALARAKWQEARRTTAALLAAAPNDAKRVFAHSQSEYWLGFAAWRGGDLRAAERAFREYARLTDQLRQLAPQNLDYVMEQGYAASNLAAFSLRPLGNASFAELEFRRSLAVFESIYDQRPSNDELQLDIADAHGWIADALRTQGRFAESREEANREKTMLDRLLGADASNFDLRERLVANAIGRARIERDAGNATKALAIASSVQNEARSLSFSDPKNIDFRDAERMVALSIVAAWLDRPRSDRPPNLAGLTNFCRSSKTRGDETLAWCRLLRARLVVSEAPSLLEAVTSDHEVAVGRYSRRRGIDFKASKPVT